MKTKKYFDDLKNIEPTEELNMLLKERLNNEVFGMKNDINNNPKDNNVIVFDNEKKNKSAIVFKVMAAVLVVAVVGYGSIKIISNRNNNNVPANSISESATPIPTDIESTPKPTATEDVKVNNQVSNEDENTNTYYKKYKFGEKASSKINSEICFDCKTNSDGTNEYTLQIGTKSFDSTQGSLKILTEYIKIEDYYYILDVNKDDNSEEIAVIMDQTENNPFTFFFHYNKQSGEIELMSTVYGNILNFEFNGDGTFNAQLPLSILQKWYKTYSEQLPSYLLNTWNGIGKFKVTGGLLESVNQKIITASPISLKLKEEITMYADIDTNSEKIEVEPQTIVIDGTDDAYFVRAKLENGNTAYIYSQDNGTLENGKYPEDVFEEVR